MSRCWCRWLWLLPLTGVLPFACSTAGRHRVASFFFDGVPPLEAPATPSSSGDQGESEQVSAVAEARPAARRFFTHTPYRENRCQGCHDPVSGQLVRSLDEGLCLTCHEPLLRSHRYVHGPAAAGACAFCHHYHAAPYPNQLLDPPTALCLRCHDRDDLTTGPYHAELDAHACTDCHDPHGGANRFFVEQDGA